MDLAGFLDQQVRAAGVPLISVRIGNPADRSTWIAICDATATQAQKDTAASVIASAVVDATVSADQDAQQSMDQKAIKAAVLTSLWGRLGRQPLAAEITAERARFVAIYKTLS